MVIVLELLGLGKKVVVLLLVMVLLALYELGMIPHLLLLALPVALLAEKSVRVMLEEIESSVLLDTLSLRVVVLEEPARVRI